MNASVSSQVAIGGVLLKLFLTPILKNICERLLLIVVTSVDSHPYLDLSNLICHHEDTRKDVFFCTM